MPDRDLNDYFYFVHVVEKQGFSAASDALGVPKSRLSRHVKQLEERMETKLIHRTTRQFKVTEVGEVFYEHARRMVDQMHVAENAVKQKRNLLSGNVTLSCSVGVAQFALKSILTRFLADHPLIRISQQVTNQNIDLVAAGVDLSIRGHAGSLPDSSLIQRPLAQVEWQLFAGTKYLQAHPPLAAPADLEGHPTLALGWQSPRSAWNLETHARERCVVDIVPRLKSDDMSTLKHAALAGAGIVALPAYTCREEVISGELQRVLPHWHAGVAQLSLVAPSRRGQPQVVVALRNYLLSEFAEAVAGQVETLDSGT